MPLGFLLSPSLVVAFSATGLASLALGVWLRLGRRSVHRLGGVAAAMRAAGRKWLAATLVFGTLSTISLALGLNDLLAGSGGPESARRAQAGFALSPQSQKQSRNGVAITLAYRGRADGRLLFDVTLETTNMALPSLAETDLEKGATLAAGGRRAGA